MIDFLLYYRAYLQHLIIFGLTIYALYRGGEPEKYAGGILSGMVLLDYLYHFVFPQGGIYEQVDLGHLIIDLLVLIGLATLAMRANRMYPIWMLGAQLISTMMHLNREVSGEMQGIAYLILTRIPSYLQIGGFAVGLYMHRRRVGRYGTYRSWRAS